MRGLVMVLMALDHSGALLDASHLAGDSAARHAPGTPLPVDHFFTRWVTHLCAPTFLFLAGTSVALSRARSRHLLGRGAFILLLDPTIVTLSWSILSPSPLVFQVLYAIGGGLMLMPLLRRLPNAWLCALALAILAGGEAIALAFWSGTDWSAPPALALTLAMGFYGGWIVIYPLLPWLAMMLLGFVFGRRLLALRAAGRDPVRLLLGWGLAALAVFLAVRGANGYGNMLLLRDDASLVQWLHVSKYPPSLSFATLTLGLMALCLAGLFRWQREQERPVRSSHPLLVFGRTALFFYLVHVPLLALYARLTGLASAAGLTTTYLAALGVLVVTYPACRTYLRYKAAHPDGWTRFV